MEEYYGRLESLPHGGAGLSRALAPGGEVTRHDLVVSVGLTFLSPLSRISQKPLVLEGRSIGKK